MIPSPVALRREAAQAWMVANRDEAEYRARFVEGTWAPRINAAREAGEIDGEQLRLAFDAVLSPLPYRRRFGAHVRLSRDAAIVELIDCGEDVAGLDDAALTQLAADYGIALIVADIEATP